MKNKYLSLLLAAFLLLPNNYAQAKDFSGISLVCGNLKYRGYSTWLIQFKSEENAVVWRIERPIIDRKIDLDIYIKGINIRKLRATVSSTNLEINLKEVPAHVSYNIDRRTLKSVQRRANSKDYSTCKVVNKEEIEATLETWRVLSKEIYNENQNIIKEAEAALSERKL